MHDNLFDYINDFINDKKDYIDIDKLNEYLDLSDLSLAKKKELLKKVYSYNLELTKNLDHEVRELQSIENSHDLDIDNITLKESSLKQNNINKNNYTKKKIDVSNYIDLINNFNDVSDFETFCDVINNDQFDEIVNELLMYYTLDLVTLKKLQTEDSENVFEQEYIRITMIIENLRELKLSNQKDNLNINNAVIYLVTPSGNVSFLNSLDKIAPEYYSTIYNTINSIFNGEFKGRKRVGKSSDGFSAPLLEVKDKQIRIFYLKISANLYLIIDVIVKQFQISSAYSEYIRKITKDAYIQKQAFLKMDSHSQEQVIEQNCVITDKINEILLPKKKVLK